MKKIALLAASAFVSFAVMAQTTSKQPTATDAKVTHTLTTKEKPAAPIKTDITKPATEAVSTTPAQTAAQPSPDDVLKVNTLKHDFGKIPQGKPVIYSFEITNTSNKPLVVENTYASCGCTTPDKIVEPIAPGATTKLKVQYSAAAVGPFTKDVHIKLAGIPTEKIVQITGEVLNATPPQETKPGN
jgi:hypothetical protein